MIPLVNVRSKITGQKTVMAETALRFSHDFERTPSQKATDKTASAELDDVSGDPTGNTPPAPAATTKGK